VIVAGEVEGPTVDCKPDWEAEATVATVVWEIDDTATEERGRLGFCPGNVRTGSCIPNLAQSS
jgi:hypothetical protein